MGIEIGRDYHPSFLLHEVAHACCLQPAQVPEGEPSQVGHLYLKRAFQPWTPQKYADGVRRRIHSPGSVDRPCAAALTCCLCNLCELILEKGFTVLNWALLCRRATCGLKISPVILAIPSCELYQQAFVGKIFLLVKELVCLGGSRYSGTQSHSSIIQSDRVSVRRGRKSASPYYLW